MDRSKTRLERKRDQNSLKQAVKYIFLIVLSLGLIFKFGLPALINMAGLIGSFNQAKIPIEKQDVIPPTAPRMDFLPEATNSGQLDIHGQAESGTTVQLFINGLNTKESIADSEGQFKFDNIHFRDGENEVYVQAKDGENNLGQASKTVTVRVDQEPPALEITKPKASDRFFDKDNPISAEGKSEEGANLTVNNHFVLVRSDGSFSTQISLTTGDNQLDFAAKDKAGNETKKIITVNYTP
ncbi:MAG: hypothetical protein AAB580_03680 [Patescibacteria group bacterium]